MEMVEYTKINFTNGSGEPINAENLNKMQDQYYYGLEAAIKVKASPVVAAVVRSNIYDASQAFEGELYFLVNPSLEKEETMDDTIGNLENGGEEE